MFCCQQYGIPAAVEAPGREACVVADGYERQGCHALARAKRGQGCVLCDRAELQRIEDIGDEDMDLSLLPPPVL